MTVSYYQCEKCKKKTIVHEGTQPPSCCGAPMTPVTAEICLQPDHAEHARPMQAQDACDDSRGG